MILSKRQILILVILISVGSLVQLLSLHIFLLKIVPFNQQEIQETAVVPSKQKYNDDDDDGDEEEEGSKDDDLTTTNITQNMKHLSIEPENNNSTSSSSSQKEEEHPNDDTTTNDTNTVEIHNDNEDDKTNEEINNDDNLDNGIPVSNFLQTSFIEPRIYPLQTLPFPCVSNNFRRNGWANGVVFIKVHKTGSTTVSDILKHLRITYPKQNKLPLSKCQIHYKHEMAYHLKNLDKRDHKKSFLFSWIREPTSRDVSHFWFYPVSIHKREPTLKNFLKSALAPSPKDQADVRPTIEGNGGYQVQYLSLKDEHDGISYPYDNPEYLFWHPTQNSDHVLQPDLLVRKVQKVLQDYDFIGITERTDESLVVLSILLGLEVYDILYIPERQQGSYSHEGSRNGCVFLQHKREVPEIDEYLNSEEYKARNAGDLLLYEAAVKSLDMSIEAIGSDVFNKKLNEFKLLQGQIEQKCTGPEFAHCTLDGKHIKHPKKNAFVCFQNIVNHYKKMKAE